MKSSIVRTALAFALSAAVTACVGPSDVVGKDKIKDVSEGMSPEQVVGVLGEGQLKPVQPTDSLRLVRGFRTQVFLLKGSQYRIIWYREKGGLIDDNITRELETPILLKDEKVIGAGWDFFDKTAQEVGIPNPYRAGERLDSISQAQLQAKPQ